MALGKFPEPGRSDGNNKLQAVWDWKYRVQDIRVDEVEFRQLNWSGRMIAATHGKWNDRLCFPAGLAASCRLRSDYFLIRTCLQTRTEAGLTHAAQNCTRKQLSTY